MQPTQMRLRTVKSPSGKQCDKLNWKTRQCFWTMRQLLWRQLLINCFQPGEQRAPGRQASVSLSEQCFKPCAIDTSLISWIPETRLACYMPEEMTKVHFLHLTWRNSTWPPVPTSQASRIGQVGLGRREIPGHQLSASPGARHHSSIFSTSSSQSGKKNSSIQMKGQGENIDFQVLLFTLYSRKHKNSEN